MKIDQSSTIQCCKITADIVNGASDKYINLLPPILGIIPQPATQWLSDLPSSIVKVGFEVTRIPGSTRVAQSSWQEEPFDRALLRRTYLAATGENPEVFGYRSLKSLYRFLATLFWPSVLAVFLAVAAIVIRSSRITTKTRLVVFTMSILTIDVLCRISFYSIVDWILWRLDSRYILGASVLSVVIVSILLTVWVAPIVGMAFRPWVTKLPRFWSWAQIGEYPNHRA